MSNKEFKELAEEKGILLLEEYKGNKKVKHKGVFLKGKFKDCECSVTYEYIEKFKNPNINILTEKGKKFYFSREANSRGYSIIQYPEGLKSTEYCILLSPKGNKWKVIWNSFHNNKNNNCPSDNMKSIGERIIQTILEENNIEYISEKSIYTGNKRPQRLDFYFELNNESYAIEYMGEQHSKQATGSWKKPLEYIQKLDKDKEKYCKKNNIKLLHIYHPNTDKKDIIDKISLFTNYDLEYTEKIENFSKHNENEEEVLKYYNKHNLKETAQYFSITENQVKGIINKTGFTKRFRKIIGLNIKTGEEKIFINKDEAEEYIGKKGVNRNLSGVSKTCGGFIFRYEDEDFSERSKKMTDKRIKVFEISKEEFKKVLPLNMIHSEYKISKTSIVEASKGKQKTANGYVVREVTEEEKEKVLDNISYIDYIKSTCG